MRVCATESLLQETSLKSETSTLQNKLKAVLFNFLKQINVLKEQQKVSCNIIDFKAFDMAF